MINTDPTKFETVADCDAYYDLCVLDAHRHFRDRVRDALDRQHVATSAAFDAGEEIPRPSLSPIEHAYTRLTEDLRRINSERHQAFCRITGVRP